MDFRQTNRQLVGQDLVSGGGLNRQGSSEGCQMFNVFRFGQILSQQRQHLFGRPDTLARLVMDEMNGFFGLEKIKICKVIICQILKSFKMHLFIATILSSIYRIKYRKMLKIIKRQGVSWSNFTWHFHLIEFFGQTPKFKAFDRIIRSTA